MVGLALLTVLSLLLMARRVHRRGHFGRKASAALRSLYPVVLGLGGWFLGVLIVLTTMPSVAARRRAAGGALDRRARRPRRLLRLGAPRLGARDEGDRLRGGRGGALVGAWLGFHAATDLLALLTAIAGAAAGANLALILLDIAPGLAGLTGRGREPGARAGRAAGHRLTTAASSPAGLRPGGARRG